MTITLTGRTLGENIKLARIKANISRKQLGDLLFMSESGVAYYESGKNTVPPRKLEKIAEICGVTVEELRDTKGA